MSSRRDLHPPPCVPELYLPASTDTSQFDHPLRQERRIPQ
jgi:hypothetical protein